MIITFLPLSPASHKFSSYEIDPVKPGFEAPLERCISINGAERVLEGKIHGPEVFRIVNGELYTGLATGEVVKVTASGVVNLVTKIGESCAGYWEEAKCGRPLSIQYCEKEKKLYVLDAYYGIWKMDLNGKNKQLLVSPRVKIDDEVPKIFNSMVLAENGDIYWTDSSTDYSLKDGLFTTLVNPSGRLLHYSASKNSSEVLTGGLAFANGVAISPNKDFVIVAETLSMRIKKHYISGSKKGQTEVFVTGLPGYPDNIQVLPDGSGFLVGQYAAFDASNPCLSRHMSKIPFLRRMLARFLTILKLPLQYIKKHFEYDLLEKIFYNISSFKSLAKSLSPITGFLYIDWNGNIVNCYMNSDRSLSSISDAIVYNQKLYLGSPHNEYIGAISIPKDLVKAFKTEDRPKPREVPKGQKPVETKPPVKETKPVETKPQITKPVTPKPVDPKPQPPKAAEPKPQAPKPVEPKRQQPKADSKLPKADPEAKKPVKEQIPIMEEIPSDTAKPNKDTLKVIKKSGPTEIPNPEL